MLFFTCSQNGTKITAGSCKYLLNQQTLISLAMRSASNLCIIPMQDYLGLDNTARMNQPSTVGKNWKWRLKKRQLTKKLQKEIYGITKRYER